MIEKDKERLINKLENANKIFRFHISFTVDEAVQEFFHALHIIVCDNKRIVHSSKNCFSLFFLFYKVIYVFPVLIVPLFICQHNQENKFRSLQTQPFNDNNLDAS